MGKQLGQQDIDALFAAANASAASQATVAAITAPLEKYNFSRAGQVSNEQMRAISTVNDLFARNLMHTLGAWLRTPVRVKLVAGEQLPFSEFLERISSPTYICSLRLEPLGALGLLEFGSGYRLSSGGCPAGWNRTICANSRSNRYRRDIDVSRATGSTGIEPCVAASRIGLLL